MALSLSRYVWPYGQSLASLFKERSQKEREMSIAMTTMPGNLLSTEDVVIEILSRLPVKNLLRCKCVCKSWHAIITSPNFISKHLRNYYDKSDSDCLLVQNCVSQAGELESLELLLDETPRVLSYDSLHMMPFHSPFLCGPCDGIFYMYRYYSDFRALWNPAINELRYLPPIPNPPSSFSYSPQYDAYGFGLHPVTKDYEVVALKDLWREKEEERGRRYPLRVFVYSSSTDSWRHWGDLSRYYNLQNNKCYICMDGVFFWLGSYEISGISPEVIISFDMATEICQEIQQPDYCRSSNDSKSLATYHDSLALVVLQEMFLHMWTLNEGCWIKKVSIGPLPQISRPIGHWKSNKLILVSVSGELILCDPSTQEISDLEFIGCSQCVGVFDYKESLVLVNNGNGCAKHNQKADTESSFLISSSSCTQNASNEECVLMESYYDGSYVESITSLFD
ncbi:hypothetical protein OIU78_002592 [Salix suchowensis]|nr:hypothetical protein OIU78_002592 [Salix suchowensis]